MPVLPSFHGFDMTAFLDWQGRASVAGARNPSGPPAGLAPRTSSASVGAAPRASEGSADDLELTSLVRHQRSSGSGASTPLTGDHGAPAGHPGGSPRRAG